MHLTSILTNLLSLQYDISKQGILWIIEPLVFEIVILLLLIVKCSINNNLSIDSNILSWFL